MSKEGDVEKFQRRVMKKNDKEEGGTKMSREREEQNAKGE